MLQAHSMRTGPFLARTPSRNARADAGGGRDLLRHLSRHHSEESVIDEMADIPSALHYYFQTLKRFHTDQAHHERCLLPILVPSSFTDLSGFGHARPLANNSSISQCRSGPYA